jgi:hypothetical protein
MKIQEAQRGTVLMVGGGMQRKGNAKRCAEPRLSVGPAHSVRCSAHNTKFPTLSPAMAALLDHPPASVMSH